jgi:hypothetical protein
MVSARACLQAVLTDADRATAALAEYYEPSGSFAGFTFLDLEPNEPFEIAATDVLAVTLLEVCASADGVRNLLQRDEKRTIVLDALADVQEDDELATAPAGTLKAAAKFYETTKKCLGANPWVIASKLCARKRPKLIPVRDTIVVAELGLTNRDFRTDWLVYRSLLRDQDIANGLASVQKAADEKVSGIVSLPLLRVLDTVVWRYRPSRARR